MTSLVQLWRPVLISPGPTADATTRSLVSKHGPTFRIPVDDLGVFFQATIGSTTVYPVAATKTENFFFLDASMVTVSLAPGPGPPNSDEILRLGRIPQVGTRPTIISIKPVSIQANSDGNAYLALEINGTNFVPGMWFMQYGSYAGVPYYHSSTQLLIGIPYHSFPDVVPVQVTTPGDSQYTNASNTVNLTFTAEATQTGVGINRTEYTIYEYGQHQTIRIYGFGFNAGTVPYLDNTMVLDNVVIDSPTQMTAQIPVAAAVGARILTVKYNSGANVTRELCIGLTTVDI